MKKQEALEILVKVGAIIRNSHIVYTHGNHGRDYVNKDALYPHTEETSNLCYDLAEEYSEHSIEAVIAPAIGGVILSQWIAHFLTVMGRNHHVLAVYAEKAEDGSFVIKRGYDKLIANKRILVVEDVLTTGGSVKKLVEVTRALGGNIVGLGAICNRGGVTSVDVGNVPKLFALVNLKLEDWPEADCPLCKEGIPINMDVGKGREFLARKQA